MLLRLLEDIYGFSQYFDFLVYFTMEPFQVVSVRLNLAVLSKAYWSSFRVIRENLDQADVKGISKIVVDFERHDWRLAHTNDFLVALRCAISDLGSIVIRIGYIDVASFDRFHGVLAMYLEEGGDEGPDISIVLRYGLQGIRAYRGRVPVKMFWFMHFILSTYSIRLKIRYGCTTLDHDDVTSFFQLYGRPRATWKRNVCWLRTSRGRLRPSPCLSHLSWLR